ncbi:peptidoglycan DD-metalloendopeptidase family protein [Dongshaea marina]|uniref:peptidoglycan DD-metalloendopeptidase family protein n=1 Tax=Dongshaea marina TaxID=2047966 RepID=UPI000D3E6366|nr:peptidoglycan DD-metalloendopeptidase family protein [Dongshaea marina]
MLFFGILLVVIALHPSAQTLVRQELDGSPNKALPGVSYSLLLDLKEAPLPKLASELHHQLYRVQPGDSLTRIWQKMNLPLKELYTLEKGPLVKKSLRQLKPGDKLQFILDQQHGFHSLQYPMGDEKVLTLSKQGDTLKARVVEAPLSSRVRFAQGKIQSNFWNAAIEAGLSENTLMELAGIFSWDIDFANDLRPGDRFSVLYSDQYRDGKFVKAGDILAAEFINQGERFTAIRNSDGRYYTPDGKAMRKSFLRAPVNFRYISSNFNPRRLHPVTGRVRPHNGIDYVAPIGTPILAAGDGIVTRSSRNSLNGNYVFIRHNSRYTTKYLHLNRRYVKTGARVKQSQVIGTLGKTGRVTGAHLHYEFVVNGVHRNPRTVKLPQASSLKGSKLAAFKLIAHQELGQLQQIQNVMLAMR